MPDGCGDNICPDCGGEMGDGFGALLERLDEAADGCSEEDVILALCFMLGGILACEPAEERHKLRRRIGALLKDATKQHVIGMCDA